MYKWPLAVSTFNFWDRLQICKFFLNPNNFWTQNKYVKKYEKTVERIVGCDYAIYVSSGSAANQLLAQYVKDSLIEKGEWPTRNKVIVNAVTWQTNVSVWVREGFEPVFIDVNLNDYSINYIKLTNYLKANHTSVAAVFPTSVLGNVLDIKKLQELEIKYRDIKFALDNCENFFGTYGGENVSSYFTSTTSTFTAHHINNGSEGGFIFTNDFHEYIYFLLARAHGLRRNLISYGFNFTIDSYTNPLVDPQFDFQLLSSNYRSTDISAFIGLLDAKKWNKHKKKRVDLYNQFKEKINRNFFYINPSRISCEDVAFCIPIILKEPNPSVMVEIKRSLDDMGIEYRSFISGNMLRQVPYQSYGKYKNFKNAEYLNDNAIYVGLHPKLTNKDIDNLCEELNIIANVLPK